MHGEHEWKCEKLLSLNNFVVSIFSFKIVIGIGYDKLNPFKTCLALFHFNNLNVN